MFLPNGLCWMSFTNRCIVLFSPSASLCRRSHSIVIPSPVVIGFNCLFFVVSQLFIPWDEMQRWEGDDENEIDGCVCVANFSWLCRMLGSPPHAPPEYQGGVNTKNEKHTHSVLDALWMHQKWGCCVFCDVEYDCVWSPLRKNVVRCIRHSFWRDAEESVIQLGLHSRDALGVCVLMQLEIKTEFCPVCKLMRKGWNSNWVCRFKSFPSRLQTEWKYLGFN